MITLTVVVPVYNEEHCLEKNFLLLRDYLQSTGGEFEILLVDDGSMDGTGEVVKRLVVDNPATRSMHIGRNKGKGYAVRQGVLDSEGQFIIFTDADLAVPLSFIGTLLSELKMGNPVAIGSRHLPNSSFKVRQGFLRQFLGEIFRRLTRLALCLNVSDITCGLKGFERAAAHDIFARSRIERWGYDAEILFLARRLGYGIKEIPVEWSHRDNSKVRIASDTVRTLGEILKIYHTFLKKGYQLSSNHASTTARADHS